jgi:hypothetical protein
MAVTFIYCVLKMLQSITGTTLADNSYRLFPFKDADHPLRVGGKDCGAVEPVRAVVHRGGQVGVSHGPHLLFRCGSRRREVTAEGMTVIVQTEPFVVEPALLGRCLDAPPNPAGVP